MLRILPWNRFLIAFALGSILLPAITFSSTQFDDRAHGGRKLYLGAGFWSEDVGKLSVSDSGGTGFLAANYLQLAASGYFRFAPLWYFSPFASYTPFGHSSPEGGETTNLLTLAARVSKSFELSTGGLDVHLGPGVLFHSVRGTGGVATLNNGLDQSQFALPSSSTTSTLFYWTLGTGFEISRARFDFDGLVTNTFSSARSVNLLFTVGYGIL